MLIAMLSYFNRRKSPSNKTRFRTFFRGILGRFDRFMLCYNCYSFADHVSVLISEWPFSEISILSSLLRLMKINLVFEWAGRIEKS